VEGVHCPGDAPVIYGPGDEMHVRCPVCEKLIRWLLPRAGSEQNNVLPVPPPG